MPKQQRTMRVEQRSQLAAMQQMESRSDEELEAETRYKAAAQAILGARAAERYDAKKARAHFQRAIAAARPQERLQIRRMADASLALAAVVVKTGLLGKNNAADIGVPALPLGELHGDAGVARPFRIGRVAAVAAEIARVAGLSHLDFLEADFLRALPEHGLAERGQVFESRG